MTVTSDFRYEVRQRYNFACGYCGVSEIAVGSELEIDHFQPISKGGTDSLQNLVYTCTTCNRFKGSYWPATNTPKSLYLLHPLQDDLLHHIQGTTDGRLIGLTDRGWFHIRWLHLNRPQLVTLRQLSQNQQTLTKLIEQAEMVNQDLRLQIEQLQSEIIQLRAIITQLQLRR